MTVISTINSTHIATKQLHCTNNLQILRKNIRRIKHFIIMYMVSTMLVVQYRNVFGLRSHRDVCTKRREGLVRKWKCHLQADTGVSSVL